MNRQLFTTGNAIFNPLYPNMRIEEILVPGYELVWKIVDPSVKLHSYIAIHSTLLGPSLGGIRIYPYQTAAQALEDSLRLSKGMSYKAAVSGVGFGGGKSVIIADPKTDKTPELLRAFGSVVELLKGRYICAEDVGCTTRDVHEVRKGTHYVVGLPYENSSGDPSIFTAFGVFRGIQAVSQKLFGTCDLKGKKIAIQGLGSVGRNLADFLFWAGAELIVADVDLETVQTVAKKYAAKIVSPDEILRTSCDILSPCAMGSIFHAKSIAELQTKAIAGAANNQLKSELDGDLLREAGILYAPDFVINAGGLLNVSVEVEENGYDPTIAWAKCDLIFSTLNSVFEIADKNKQSTNIAANMLADYRIQHGIGRRQNLPVFHHNNG